MLPSAAIMNGFVALSVMINVFKKTIIKKLKTTPLPATKFIFAVVSFNLLIGVLAGIIFCTVGLLTYNDIFFGDSDSDKKLNSDPSSLMFWFELVGVMFLASLLASFIGLIIGLSARSSTESFNTAITIFLLTVFFSRMYLPYSLPFIGNNIEIVKSIFEVFGVIFFFSTFTSLFNFVFFKKCYWEEQTLYGKLFKDYQVQFTLSIIILLIVIAFLLSLFCFYRYKL